MLFDDEEQIEVRHVISLAHHDVSVYSGGGVTPEGELWIKRNALCLSRKPDSDGGQSLSKPFYLFSENCSAKEDFYFALLRNKEQTFGTSRDEAPAPKTFDVKHMISLVEKLHATEDNVHSRWVNALIGRIFLGIHRTADIENFIREKITKKIARVKRPAFLTNITIRRIDTGEAAPFFTNFKLRELTINGDCVVEADVKYTGNFRIEVAATAKIDLGPRIRPREVNLVLAVVAKRIEGHGLLKIKPPPSNRCWIAFQTRPKMELTIEPIVSARQITYGPILRQIESRIKEVVAETLVLPFWDDIPFFRTEHKMWRGGIFEGDDAVVSDDKNAEDIVAQEGDVDAVDKLEEKPELLADLRPIEKTMSLPVLDKEKEKEKVKEALGTGLFGKKTKTAEPSPAASTTSLETSKIPLPAGGLRSPQIISNTREPVVGTDSAHADIFKPSTSPPDSATSYIAALHSRSRTGSPLTTPSDSPGKAASTGPSLTENPPSLSLTTETGDEEKKVADDGAAPRTPGLWTRRNTTSSTEAEPTGDVPDSPVSTKSASKYATGSLGRNFWLRRENSTASSAVSSTTGEGPNLGQKTNNTLAALSNAALQTKQWGWNALQRRQEARKNSSSEGANQQVDLSQPMGRGQPLPPPGTPLPMPTNGTTKIAPRDVPKRKPVPPKHGSGSSSTVDSGEEQTPTPPLPARRRRGTSHDEHDGHNDQKGEEGEEGMLVIAAPEDSEPGTPAAVDDVDFEPMWDDGVGSSLEETTDDDGSLRRTNQTTQVTTPPAQSILEPASQKEDEPTTPEIEAFTPPALPKDEGPPAMASEAATLPEKPSVETERASTPPPVYKATADDDDFSGWMDETELEEPGPESPRITRRATGTATGTDDADRAAAERSATAIAQASK